MSRTSTSLSQTEILAALINHEGQTLAEFLPAAEAHLPRLLADREDGPLSTGAIERYCKAVSRSADPEFRKSERSERAWHLGVTSKESDPVLNVRNALTHAGFALGLVLGVRLGAGRP